MTKPRCHASVDAAKRGRAPAVALVVLFFGLLAFSARTLSYTADEPAYVTGGYATLVHGPEALAMLAQRGYPPLLPVLEGLTVFAGDPGIAVAELPGWPDAFDTFAHAFVDALRAAGSPGSPLRAGALDRVIFVSRLPSIWLAVLLAALVCRWGRELWGRPAGLIALGVLVLDPTMLAHAPLATTDIGVTAFGTAALYATWRWARTGRRGGRWSLAAGGLLGATLLTKISGPIWALCAAVLMIAGALHRGRQHAGQAVGQIASAAIVTLGLLWIGYGFSVGPLRGSNVPVLAPDFWESVFYLTSYKSVFFALGWQFYENQWWYFPLAFMIKNPLPLLAAWTGGGITLARRAWRARRQGGVAGSHRRLALLLLLPLVYGGVALTMGMNIGYRHMLPIHPFLHLIAAGGLACWLRSGRRRMRYAALGLGLAGAVATFRVFPNEIAFFNCLIGSPTAGYRYLVDSNLDWGQRNNLLEAYLEAHPEVREAPPESAFRPAPGRYIIGASQLQGVGIGDPQAYAWFRYREPVDDLDRSFLIYDVPPPAPAWVAQCGDPAPPLDAAALQAGLGTPARAVRTVGFDCTQAWLFPDGGKTPGLVALDFDLLQQPGRRFPSLLPRPAVARDAFVARRLAAARLSYENRQAPHPFALYEVVPGGDSEHTIGTVPGAVPGGEDDRTTGTVPGAALADPNAQVFTVPVALAPHEVAPSRRCTPCDAGGGCDRPGACTLDGPLAFLGVTVAETGDGLDVETWWEVVEGPIARNFSIMAHLLDAEGTALGAADGLGVWPLTLQAGDVFVQRHRFAAPDGDAVWLRTGAYWLDTLERWPAGADGDALLVALDVP